MRNAFADALLELAREDERVVLLTGDLGFTVLEPFMHAFPDRFFNVGVAEQNMVGLATGLAEAGYVPFAYSIATFMSMRPYEFIRNGALLHELPVRFVGVGAGLDYAYNGITHYALEDVALMRAQPEMTIVAPADVDQARASVFSTRDLSGTIYFRIGKQSAVLPGLDGRFELGRAELLGSGCDVALVSLGTSAHEAVAAAQLLDEQGLTSTVAVVSSLNTSPDGELAELLGRVPLAVTVEAHYVTGGLGSHVCELVAESGAGCRVVRCGVRRMPRGVTGTQAFMHDLHGLSPRAIATAAAAALELQV